MGYDSKVLWGAMKDAKYRNTLMEFQKIPVSASTDVQEYLNQLLLVVANAVHAEVGTLWYYAKFTDNRIHPKASCGGSDISGLSLALGEGIAGQVIQEQKSKLIQDCQKDPRWSGKVDNDTGFMTKSMICAPLMDQENCFGCVQLINRLDGESYDEKDQLFLEELCQEITKFFRAHSDELMFGNFGKESGADRSGLNTVLNSVSKSEMLEDIRRIPQYLKLKGIRVWLFEECCILLWGMVHGHESSSEK